MWFLQVSAMCWKCRGTTILLIFVHLALCESFCLLPTQTSLLQSRRTVLPSITSSQHAQDCYALLCRSRFERCVRRRRGALALHCGVNKEPVEWVSLPHVDRKQAIRTAAAVAASHMLVLNTNAATPPAAPVPLVARSAAAIEAWGAIPVWPAWPTPSSPFGGRVRPMALPVGEADPFLLLAHHKHSFSPGDPLRRPFREVGGALGLPYVGDEGFALHPHRGIDIWTMVLEGSDGFRHRDSLGGQCTYRGGATQVMRAGCGALHEEMWETSPERTTRIELLQLWVNLPASLKMSPPSIRYLGADWGAPYPEQVYPDPLTGALTRVLLLSEALAGAGVGEGGGLGSRPAVDVQLGRVPAGGSWAAARPREHTVLCYLLRGALQVGPGGGAEVRAGSTCRFAGDGEGVWLRNTGREEAEVLLLSGEPLGEPVALGGPIVMNTRAEIAAAYAQLQAGTFLQQR